MEYLVAIVILVAALLGLWLIWIVRTADRPGSSWDGFCFAGMADVCAPPAGLPAIPPRLHYRDAFPYAHQLRITVDGKDVKGVIEYSVPEGWVLAYRYHDNGQPILAPGGEDLVQDRLRGNVEVTYDPDR